MCVMCSKKIRVYWKEKESKGARIVFGTLQVYSDETASANSCGAIEMHPVNTELLNPSVELRQKLFCPRCTPVKLLPVEHEQGGCGEEEFEELDSNEVGDMVLRSSELVL